MFFSHYEHQFHAAAGDHRGERLCTWLDGRESRRRSETDRGPRPPADGDQMWPHATRAHGEHLRSYAFC